MAMVNRTVRQYKALQLTAKPLRGLSAAELCRYALKHELR
jgi:hypothetical protein